MIFLRISASGIFQFSKTVEWLLIQLNRNAILQCEFIGKGFLVDHCTERTKFTINQPKGTLISLLMDIQ